MRFAIAYVALFLMSMGARAQTDQVIIADLKAWPGIVAFYVDAPRPVQERLRAAVELARASHEQSCSEQKETHWLCVKNQLRYLRGISGMGKALKSGWVCDNWISRQRYYSQAMMVEDGCVRIDWDWRDKNYRVAWPGD